MNSIDRPIPLTLSSNALLSLRSNESPNVPCFLLRGKAGIHAFAFSPKKDEAAGDVMNRKHRTRNKGYRARMVLPKNKNNDLYLLPKNMVPLHQKRRTFPKA